MMEFPIVDLLDHEESARWIEQHFHLDGLHCPRCHAPAREARPFRRPDAAPWWCIAASDVSVPAISTPEPYSSNII